VNTSGIFSFDSHVYNIQISRNPHYFISKFRGTLCWFWVYTLCIFNYDFNILTRKIVKFTLFYIQILEKIIPIFVNTHVCLILIYIIFNVQNSLTHINSDQNSREMNDEFEWKLFFLLYLYTFVHKHSFIYFFIFSIPILSF
jgi:hypothetical protein